MEPVTRHGPLRLVVIQPTPFCNIACDYCYLSNRTDTGRMDRDVLIATANAIRGYPHLDEDLSIVWHAGEPLTVHREFYKDAFATFSRLADRTRVQHAIQTNGLLLDDTWLRLFSTHNVSVGLSLDGPAWLHDLHRVRRNGRGTHAQVMRAVRALQDADVPFAVIAVVTSDTLDHPDEFLNFFIENGIHQLGMNIEEIEGENSTSSMSGASAWSRYEAFIARTLDLANHHPELRVREFTVSKALILGQRTPITTQQVPLQTLNVDFQGNFSTFSPELLDARHQVYGDFRLGNVRTHSLAEALESEKLVRMNADLKLGIANCKTSCSFFGVCGGGTPSNKAFELGTFAGTETMHCRMTQQTIHRHVGAYLLQQLRSEKHVEQH